MHKKMGKTKNRKTKPKGARATESIWVDLAKNTGTLECKKRKCH
jgi:hypothetical protein